MIAQDERAATLEWVNGVTMYYVGEMRETNTHTYANIVNTLHYILEPRYPLTVEGRAEMDRLMSEVRRLARKYGR